MSNFGIEFHNLLKRIHYPGINQYEPYNFDWFVYQPGLEPFLTWIVNNLSDENFLTEDELTRFDRKTKPRVLFIHLSILILFSQIRFIN
jgi:hypothetical protein